MGKNLKNSTAKGSKKKVPVRKCVACREHREKKDLLRVVRLKEGDVLVDFTHRANGRGAYICKDLNCYQKAVKQGAFQRALKCKVEDAALEAIKEAIIREEKV